MSTTAIDIAQLTDNKDHQNDLLILQNQIFDEVVRGQKQSQELLDELCRCAEGLVPDALASIMLFDENSDKLKVEAAPNIPNLVVAELRGLRPSLESGSCSHAVFTGEPTYVSNTLKDKRWKNIRNLAEKYQIAACWSQPILLDDEAPIGSFALSSFATREPDEFQKNVLHVCSNLVSIILYRKAQEEKLWQIAHHDALTGLPNRLYVDSQLQHAISNAGRNNNCLALMFIDMDNFKDINDSYGHDFGDVVLLQSMELLKSCLREGDIVARHGGDEFLLILENFRDKLAVETIAKKILRTFRKPLLIEGRRVPVHFSIGICLYPDDGQTSSELLKNADIAMYQAKASGKNSIQYFKKELAEKIMRKVQLEQEMREALALDEFEIYFQPQYLHDGKAIDSLEVLLRWHHPLRGLLLPESFIPVAEQSQLINEVTQMVFIKALQQGARWIKAGLEIPRLSINLSSVRIANDCTERLKVLLQEFNYPATKLELEITESLVMKRGDVGINELAAARDMGVSLTIDDFGTGYSSLGQLKKLPINKIKIDQSFISNLCEDDDDQAIVKTMIAMGHSMKIQMVAEGVETAEQQDFLLENGCEVIQGNYRQPAVPAAEIESLMIRQGV